MQQIEIASQFIECLFQFGVIVWWNEQCGAVPEFAKTLDVAEDEGTSGDGRFEDREAKRFVSRGRCKDGGARHPRCQVLAGQMAQVMNGVRFARWHEPCLA